jgi:putative oxidoreductase
MGVFRPFKKNKDIGVFLFRLFIGFRLLYGVMDNIFSRDRMLEFEAFLQTHHFPYSHFAAVISIYAQAIAGLLIIIGYNIRWAAVLMIINFTVALVVVHWGQSIEEMTPALAMLFAAVLFLFVGAGRFSLQKEPLVVFRK